MVHDAEYGVDHRVPGLALEGADLLASGLVDQDHALGRGAVIGGTRAGEDGGVGGAVKGGAVEVLIGGTDVVGAIAGAVVLLIAEEGGAAVHGIGAVVAGLVRAVVLRDLQGRVDHVDGGGGAVVRGDHGPGAGLDGGIHHGEGAAVAQDVRRPDAAVDAQDPGGRDHIGLGRRGGIALIGLGQGVRAAGHDAGIAHYRVGVGVHHHCVPSEAVGLNVDVVHGQGGFGVRAAGGHHYGAQSGEVVGVLAVRVVGELQIRVPQRHVRVRLRAHHGQEAGIGGAGVIEGVAQL